MHTKRSVKVARWAALAVAVAVAAAPAWGRNGNRVTVEGQDDPAVDRQNLQDAIDAVRPGGVVRLEGVFQLDGEVVLIDKELRLRGKAVDNDGDGKKNEDWVDGVDNDGDGSIDEDDWDAVIRGLVGPDGLPLPEVDRTVVFNRAIFVRGLTEEVSDLRIENILFSNHFRAITLEPDTGSTGGTVCENLFTTEGSLEDLIIRRNRFDNNDRSVELEGEAEESTIEKNLITNSVGIALIVQGESQGCPLTAGGFGTFPTGTPEDTDVEKNRVFSRAGVESTIGLFNRAAVGTDVEGNEFAVGFGVLTENDPEVEIEENEFVSGTAGVFAQGATEEGSIEDNLFDGGFFSVWIDLDASGYEVEGNDFQNAFFFEVLLDVGSTNNLIVVGPDDRVSDLGTGNTIVVED